MSKTPEQITEIISNSVKDAARIGASFANNESLVVRAMLKAFKRKPSITLDDLIQLLEKEKDEEQGTLEKVRIEEGIKLLLSQK